MLHVLRTVLDVCDDEIIERAEREREERNEREERRKRIEEENSRAIRLWKLERERERRRAEIEEARERKKVKERERKKLCRLRIRNCATELFKEIFESECTYDLSVDKLCDVKSIDYVIVKPVNIG